ncbi:MAG: nuclear transport factor 2 family protein [Pseudomonadota bacterium]
MRHEVLDTNEAFYRAIRNGDMLEMEALWAFHRPVSCTHPGWTPLDGRTAVMESWRAILTEQEPPDLWPRDAEAVVTGATAMVLCLEHLGRLELMACNTFVHEADAWRLIDHRASRVTPEQVG